MTLPRDLDIFCPSSPRIKPLVDQFEKRLRRGDIAQIEQHIVPESRVKQVQHGVLDAADVQIHSRPRAVAGGMGPHPITLGLRAAELALVARVKEPEVIPAASSPLRHGVGLAF